MKVVPFNQFHPWFSMSLLKRPVTFQALDGQCAQEGRVKGKGALAGIHSIETHRKFVVFVGKKSNFSGKRKAFDHLWLVFFR